MYVGRDWDPFDVGEDDVFTLDFVNDLGSGETIVSAAVYVVALRGLDSAPNSNLRGAVTFLGSKISQEFKGGVSGEKYRLVGSIVTSSRPELKLWSHFECRDPAIPS